MMEDEDPLCVFCKQPITLYTYAGQGSVWIHVDGFRQCKPNYATFGGN